MRVRVKELLIPSVLGGVGGCIVYSLSWTYHLRYFGLNWLGPLLGADGESGYDAMLYESVIDFAIAAIVLYFLGKVIWVAITSSARKPA